MAAPATIKIAEDSLPRVSGSSESRGHSTALELPPRNAGMAGGIYHTRSISRALFDRRSGGDISRDPEVVPTHSACDVEEGDDWRGEHVKKKQVFRGATLLWFISLWVLSTATLVLARSMSTRLPSRSRQSTMTLFRCSPSLSGPLPSWLR
ncbi:hypothetical protein VTK56DRAFT_7238 [Thermocarpiscus australiensis]